MPLSIAKNKLFNNYFFIVAFIFFGHSFLRNGLSCLIPLLFLFFIKKLNFEVITLTFISSLLLVEIGNGYSESIITPGFIRYLSLVLFGTYILFTTKGNQGRQLITIFLLIISQLIAFTLTDSSYRSNFEAIKMISYIAIIIFVGFRSLKIKYDVSNLIINLGYLYTSSLFLGFLFVQNLYGFDGGFMYSYSSLRGFILIAFSLSFYKKGLLKTMPLGLLTFLALIYTGSRIHFFMFLIIIFIAILKSFFMQIKDLIRKGTLNFINSSLIMGIIITIYLIFRNFTQTPFQFKPLGVFYTLWESQKSQIDFEKLFMAADVFRYYENKQWINSGFNTLIFGNGIGSGININDLLNADISEMTAYSKEMINSGVAFGLHDIWTWYGISIGIVGMCIIALPLILFRPNFKLNGFDVHLLNFSLLCCYATMWYSLSGNLLFWGIVSLLRYDNKNKKVNLPI